MTFHSPLMLLALIPVAALAIGYLIMQRRRQRYAVRFAALPMLDRLAPKRPAWRRHVAGGLVLLALSALGLAAARPEANIRVPQERATVILAIDASGSMQADDVPPNRLEAAKAAAAQFVEDLPEQYNVGVVQFAGSASVVAAPSQDHLAAEQRIRQIRGAGGGTAIGESVFTALDEVERLAQESPDTLESVPARLVILSDGDNTAGRSPEASAAAAREAGIPVSTISYGSDGGSIPSQRGRTQVPVDDQTLRQMAEATDGQHYRAENNAELREVYQDIGSSIGWTTRPVELTPYLALAGLVVVCTAGALSLRWFSRII